MSTESTSTVVNFQQLLNTIADEQTFELSLTNTNLQCKQLTTLQLKELIETVVDSPVTQAIFNSAIAKVFKNSLVEKTDISNFTILDRLLFILQTRTESLSPTKTTNVDGVVTNFNLIEIKTKLLESLQTNAALLEEQTIQKDKYVLTFGIPTLKTEQQLNDEIYKKLEIDVKNVEELRKLIGEAFINEIAKTLRTIKIEDNLFDFSTGTFKNRVKLIETLPASIIQDVLLFIEQYKAIIDKSLTVNGTMLPVDGSLFSTR